MTRSILTLKHKIQPLLASADTRQLQQIFPTNSDGDPPPLEISIGCKPKKDSKPKASPPVIMEALYDALKSRSRVFIQLRSGAGYCGTPVRIDRGIVTLSHATIHGTKNKVEVSIVHIQLGDCSQVSHMHPVPLTGVSS